MAVKVSGHCCIVIVFNVKNMILESGHDSVSSLSYIFNVAPVAFKTIYEIGTLACAFHDCIVGFYYYSSFLFSLIGKFCHSICRCWVYYNP